jgi:hypothetical protein
VKGTPDNPMTRQEVFDKALDLVGPIVGGARGRELVSTLMAIDKVDNVLTLRPLLQA